MLKTFFRSYSCVTRVNSCKHLVSRYENFFSSRQRCSLPQEIIPKESPVLEYLYRISKQNELQEEKIEPKALEKPIKHRRQFQHPQSLLGAVHRSQFLKDMVNIGVNLFKIQSLRPLDFDFIVSLRSWDPDPPERIRYLLQLGVSPNIIPRIITDNPWILKENMEDMQVRVNYLLSKKFSPEDIARIIEGCPKLLTMKTHDIDSRLGYFQQGFKLSGDQVRKVIISNPWMISWPQQKLRDTLDTLYDKLSFTISDMKTLILHHGKIWKTDVDDVQKTAEFLHRELNMSHKKIVQHGYLLTKHRTRLKYRYDFMVFMGRANFDPTKPCYYSYDILCDGTLEDFCKKLRTDMDALELFAKSV